MAAFYGWALALFLMVASSGLTKELRGHPLLPPRSVQLPNSTDTASASASASATALAIPAALTNSSSAFATAAAILSKRLVSNMSHLSLANLSNASIQLFEIGMYHEPTPQEYRKTYGPNPHEEPACAYHSDCTFNAAALEIQHRDQPGALKKDYVILIVLASVIVPVVIVISCCVCKPRTPWLDNSKPNPAEAAEAQRPEQAHSFADQTQRDTYRPR